MTTVEQIIAAKANAAVFTIGPEASVYDAMKLMADKSIGALVVIENGAVAGIVTERDYARKIVLEQRTSQGTSIRDIMSSPVVSVGLGHTSDDCIRLMGEHRMRHLPVLQGDRVIGMVSIRDLLDDIVADRRFSVAELEAIVASRAATDADATEAAAGDR